MKLHKQLHRPEFDTMALILAVWICTLPFIALVVVPMFGTPVGIGVAVALLILSMVVCWVLCIPTVARLFKPRR